MNRHHSGCECSACVVDKDQKCTCPDCYPNMAKSIRVLDQSMNNVGILTIFDLGTRHRLALGWVLRPTIIIKKDGEPVLLELRIEFDRPLGRKIALNLKGKLYDDTCLHYNKSTTCTDCGAIVGGSAQWPSSKL